MPSIEDKELPRFLERVRAAMILEGASLLQLQCSANLPQLA